MSHTETPERSYAIPPQTTEKFKDLVQKIYGLKLADSDRIIRTLLTHAKNPTQRIASRLEENPSITIIQNGRILFGVNKDKIVVAVADAYKLAPPTKEEVKEWQRRENRKLGINWRKFRCGPPPLNMQKVVFSFHALHRFDERFPGHSGSKPAKNATELLSLSTEEKMSSSGGVKRLIDNRLQEARYFRLGTCRFVVYETESGNYLVKTIEWADLR